MRKIEARDSQGRRYSSAGSNLPSRFQGIPCVKGPLREARPDRSAPVTGTICVSPELGNLVVHGENMVNLGGQNLRIVSELEEVRMDAEPPAEWFQIPADFQLIQGHPGKPAPRN